MRCPYSLAPHQIRGLDCETLLPVVRWLVKKVIETREEEGDKLRLFSEYQFERNNFLTPEDRWVQLP
jgi:CCDC93 protein N-terminal domain